MNCCCCSVDDQTCRVLQELNVLNGIQDLNKIIGAYSSCHGVRQPFQTADDDPFDDRLGFGAAYTMTLDAFLLELHFHVQQKIHTWCLDRSSVNGWTKCTVGGDSYTPYRVSCDQWILNVRTGTGKDSCSTRNIVGLDPKQDSRKIISVLWRYGTDNLKSKLCPFVVRLHPDDDPIEMIQKRVSERIRQTMRPLVDFSEPPNTGNNNTFENELDRIRHILEQKFGN